MVDQQTISINGVQVPLVINSASRNLQAANGNFRVQSISWRSADGQASIQGLSITTDDHVVNKPSPLNYPEIHDESQNTGLSLINQFLDNPKMLAALLLAAYLLNSNNAEDMTSNHRKEDNSGSKYPASDADHAFRQELPGSDYIRQLQRELEEERKARKDLEQRLRRRTPQEAAQRQRAQAEASRQEARAAVQCAEQAVRELNSSVQTAQGAVQAAQQAVNNANTDQDKQLARQQLDVAQRQLEEAKERYRQAVEKLRQAHEKARFTEAQLQQIAQFMRRQAEKIRALETQAQQAEQALCQKPESYNASPFGGTPITEHTGFLEFLKQKYAGQTINKQQLQAEVDTWNRKNPYNQVSLGDYDEVSDDIYHALRYASSNDPVHEITDNDLDNLQQRAQGLNPAFLRFLQDQYPDTVLFKQEFEQALNRWNGINPDNAVVYDSIDDLYNKLRYAKPGEPASGVTPQDLEVISNIAAPPPATSTAPSPPVALLRNRDFLQSLNINFNRYSNGKDYLEAEEFARAVNEWNRKNPQQQVLIPRSVDSNKNSEVDPQEAGNIWSWINPIASLSNDEWGQEDYVYKADLTEALRRLNAGRTID